MPTDGPSAVLPCFEAYQAARLDLAQALAELAIPPTQRPGAEAKVPSAIEEAEYREVLTALENYAPTLARTVDPLCYDLVPGVQLSALVALSRLARASDRLSGTFAVRRGLLPQVLQLLSNPGVRKDVRLGAASLLLQLLREPETCKQAIEAGALPQLVENLETAEPEMKALTLWCLGTVAAASQPGAAAVLDAGGLRAALLCLSEPQLAVLRIAASLLADIAKHDPELAAAVFAAGAVESLAALLASRDPAVRSQALRALAQVGKWGRVPGGGRIPAELHAKVIALIGDADETVSQHAATLVRALGAPSPLLRARSAPRRLCWAGPACRAFWDRRWRSSGSGTPVELREMAGYDSAEAHKLVEAGCLPALLDALIAGRGSPLPAAMALGLLGGYSESLAMAVVEAGAVPILAQGLRLSGVAHVRAAVADSLRQIAHRSTEATLAIAESGAILVLHALAALPDERQRSAAESALAVAAKRLAAADAYEPLRQMVEQASASPATLAPALLALAALFSSSADAGRHQAHFVAAGHMRQLQAMRAGANGELRSGIDALNATFPEEVVEQLQPGYEQSLLAKIEDEGEIK